MAASAMYQNAQPPIDEIANRPAAADPIADYVSLWRHLDRIHQERSLTEEGWSFLTDHLQRPIEMRLMDRQPKTLSGAAACLEMASCIVDQFERDGINADVAWYRRLLKHLIQGAQHTIQRQARIESQNPAGASRNGSARDDGMDLSREPCTSTNDITATTETAAGLFGRNGKTIRENGQ